MLSETTKRRFTGQRVLITGARGYLAHGLVGLLKDTDCCIIRLVRPGTQLLPIVGRAMSQDVLADIGDYDTWSQALQDVQVVFHLAAQTSVYVADNDPLSDLRDNIAPMMHLLEVCRKTGQQPTVVFTGTATQAGIPTALPVDETHIDQPITIYDLHKLMAEQYLAYYTTKRYVRGTTLRLANVYGPGPRSSSTERGVLNMMIRKALKGETLTVYGTGCSVRDYIYVDDVTNALIAASEMIDQLNRAHFVIGSGMGYTISEAVHLVAERVSAFTGRRVDIKHIDPPSPQSPIEARNFIADTTRFTQSAGWKAQVSLVDGIDRTIQAFLAEG